MDLSYLAETLSTRTFPVYQNEEVRRILSLPDQYSVQDPLVVRKTKRQERHKKQRDENGLEMCLHHFFERFNTEIEKSKFLLEFKDFKRVFLNELRSGVFKSWKLSSHRKNKEKVLESISKEYLSYELVQWMADYYNIVILYQEKEFIPRKSKTEKPVLKIV